MENESTTRKVEEEEWARKINDIERNWIIMGEWEERREKSRVRINIVLIAWHMPSHPSIENLITTSDDNIFLDRSKLSRFIDFHAK